MECLRLSNKLNILQDDVKNNAYLSFISIIFDLRRLIVFDYLCSNYIIDESTMDLEGTLSENENCNYCFVNSTIKLKITRSFTPQNSIIIDATISNSGSIDANYLSLPEPTRLRSIEFISLCHY